MRNAKKNETTHIALRFKGVEDYVDSQGHKTGEKIVKYYSAQTFSANVSGAKGGVFIDVFGTDASYDKVMVMSKLSFKKLKFDDNTVFFIDKKPEYKNGLPLYDYRVYKIAETKNEVAIAIKKANK